MSNPIYSLPDLLQDLAGNATLQAERDMSLIVKRLEEQGAGQGSLNIKLTFKKIAGEDKVEIIPDVSASLPKRTYRGGEAFITGDHKLSAFDPKVQQKNVTHLRTATGTHGAATPGQE